MRAKGDAIFLDLAQFTQAENLEAAGIGENRPRPCHETMQSTEIADGLDSRAQIKMVGIAQQDLNAKIFEEVLGHAFDRGERANRHKYRGFDFAMGRNQSSGTGGAGAGFNLKLKGHCEDCSEGKQETQRARGAQGEFLTLCPL